MPQPQKINTTFENLMEIQKNSILLHEKNEMKCFRHFIEAMTQNSYPNFSGFLETQKNTNSLNFLISICVCHEKS